jgi:hypothetical protein
MKYQWIWCFINSFIVYYFGFLNKQFDENISEIMRIIYIQSTIYFFMGSFFMWCVCYIYYRKLEKEKEDWKNSYIKLFNLEGK